MPSNQLLLSRSIDPTGRSDRERPGFLLALLLVALPFVLIYAADVQALV